MSNNPSPILFFDGVCGLCNKAVDFSLSHQKNASLRYAPLQGETAQKLLPESLTKDLNTLVLWTPKGVKTESDAVLILASHFRAPWNWLAALRIVPRFLRNGVYRMIAKNRYRIFGKKDTCRLPSLAEKELFLP